MKRFLLYSALFLLPFLVVLLPYFITDPFKVLYHYDNYYDTGGKEYYINTNRSYVSTMMYIQNKEMYHYDSFIFGSSRSEYFMVDDWKKYIPGSASCFHFDGSGESLYNIHKKLKYIAGRSPIRNVLICMERELHISRQTRLWTFMGVTSMLGRRQFQCFAYGVYPCISASKISSSISRSKDYR